MPYIISPLTGRTIRCILFDLGSTLWMYRDDATLRKAEHISEQHAFAVLRRHLNAHERARLDALQPGQFSDVLFSQPINDTQPGVYDEADVVADTLATLQQLGFSNITPTIGAEVFEAMRDSIVETRVFFDDALSTLAQLKARGFLLGIVSNRSHGGEKFIQEVRTLGLLDYFDPRHIAISIDLKIRKPDARIFQYTLDALEIPAAEAVMVGDQLGADVYGSQHLGMYGVWKPHPQVFAEARTAMDGQDNENIPPLATLKRIALSRMKNYRPDRATLEALQPDMVIEHLHELLDVFVKVGKQ